MAGKQNRSNGKSKRRNNKRIVGPGGPIPSEYHATFKYSSRVSISGAAATVSSYAFRLNGLFDPDFTGAGSQPMYYDQFSALYSKYRVLGARWSITLCNEASGAVVVAVCPSMQNSVDVDMAANTQQLRAKTFILGAVNGAGCIKQAKGGCRMAEVWGVPEAAVKQEDDWAALTTGNPNNVVYLWLSTTGVSTGATTLLRAWVTISYDVVFHMPKVVAAS